MNIFKILLCFAILCTTYSYGLNLIDDFSNGMSQWNNLSGNYAIDNGLLKHTAPVSGQNPYGVIELNMDISEDFIVQADFSINSQSLGNNSVGFAVIQNPTNLLWFHFFPGYTGGAFRVEKWINGTKYVIVSNQHMGFTPQPNQQYTMKLISDGYNYTSYIKNEVGDSGFDYSYSYTDNSWNNGRIGFMHYTWNALGQGYFDNFKADFTAQIPEPATVFMLVISLCAMIKFIKLK